MREKGFALILILLIIVAVALVAGGAYYLGKSGNKIIPQNQTVNPTNQPINIADEISNWKTYTDLSNRFSFKYPANVTLDTNRSDGVALFLKGPTQREQTEIYDGLFIRFIAGSLEGKTVKEKAELDIKNDEDNQLGKTLLYPTIVKINDIEGYKVRTSGLGEATSYYLPLDNSRYLLIVDATNDPKGLGFQKIVDQILSTLKLLDQSQISEIANWKTYTNSVNHYFIKIPQDWITDDHQGVFLNIPGEVTFTPSSEMNITEIPFRTKIAITSMSTQQVRYSLNTQEQFNEWLSMQPATDVRRLAKVGNLTINGSDAVKFISTTLPGDATEQFFSIVVWFRKDGNNYYIELGGNEKVVRNYSKVFDKILSTFKFTN